MSVPGSDPGAVRRHGHVLIYPPDGRLIFATDFHGQLEDFRAVVSRYTERRERSDDVYLLFAGDFVHGPSYTRDTWPDWRDDAYHPDDSPTILAELEALMASDDRVHSLLGNHEHAHIGGPHTQKFHDDPDEVEWLEQQLGPDRTARALALFRTFALAALTPCGVLFTHGAPACLQAGFEEVAHAELDGHAHHDMRTIYEAPIVGELLWARWGPAERTSGFLRRMSHDGITPRVGICGHDVTPEGVDREAHHLVVSTSFGVPREAKTLVEIDLAGDYRSPDDLRDGVELLPLYEKNEEQ